MKTVIIAATLSMIAALASAQTADTSWHHPDGLFTLAPAAAGAQELHPTAQGDLADFAIGPVSAARICNVRQSDPPAGSWTQDSLNHFMARIGTMQSAPDPNFTITDKRSFDRDGITVLSYRISQPNLVMHEWMFNLATPNGALLEKIHCAGAPPLTPADEAKFDAFLETLHFPTHGQN